MILKCFLEVEEILELDGVVGGHRQAQVRGGQRYNTEIQAVRGEDNIVDQKLKKKNIEKYTNFYGDEFDF